MNFECQINSSFSECWKSLVLIWYHNKNKKQDDIKSYLLRVWGRNNDAIQMLCHHNNILNPDNLFFLFPASHTHCGNSCLCCMSVLLRHKNQLKATSKLFHPRKKNIIIFCLIMICNWTCLYTKVPYIFWNNYLEVLW